MITDMRSTFYIHLLCDSLPSSGLGHARRSLALGKELASMGCCVKYFLLENSLLDLFQQSGVHYTLLTDTKDPAAFASSVEDSKESIVIIDTYLLTKTFIDKLGRLLPDLPVIAFDDYGEKAGFPVLGIINPGFGAKNIAYPGRFALFSALGPEFLPLPETCLKSVTFHYPRKPFGGSVERLLLVMGGGDPENQTIRLVNILKKTKKIPRIEVVAGPQYGSIQELKNICNDKERFTLHHNPVDFHLIASKCDLAVSGSGLTVYELLYLGIPVITLSLADNQDPTAKALEKDKLGINIGRFDEVSDQDIESVLEEAWSDPQRLHNMSENGQKKIDGLGAGRLAKRILEIAAHFRGNRYSLEDVTDEYQKSSTELEPYKMACWGSQEGMINRFYLGLDLLDLKEVKSWLDVGCGPGDFFLTAKKRISPQKFIGLDICKETLSLALKRCNSNNNVKFYCQSFMDPIEGEPFELVTCIGVLQKCGYLVHQAIQRLAELVSEGGTLLLTTKNLSWNRFNDPGFKPYTGHAWYLPDQIKKELRNTGFDIHDMRGFEPRGKHWLPINDAHSLMVLAKKR